MRQRSTLASYSRPWPISCRLDCDQKTEPEPNGSEKASAAATEVLAVQAEWCRSLRGPFRQKNAAPATAGAGCGIEASSWLIKAGANWFCKKRWSRSRKRLERLFGPGPCGRSRRKNGNPAAECYRSRQVDNCKASMAHGSCGTVMLFQNGGSDLREIGTPAQGRWWS
jgi:hypothetical protein